MVKEDVKAWIASLSGFQGGNPRAELWFCGLEFQQTDIQDKVICKLHGIENPPFCNTVDDMREGFNRNMTKIAESYYGEALEKDIFSDNGKIFKMNLYPLPQSSSSEIYDEKIYVETGLRTKSELRALCLEPGNRFDNFKKLVDKNKDTLKVIVCCSTTASDSFLLAFANEKEFFGRKKQLTDTCTKLPTIFTGKMNKFFSHCKLSSGVILFVIPFISGNASSLKSSIELVEIGRIIREAVYSKY